jgi:TP901 family phage tail tape measure protein
MGASLTRGMTLPIVAFAGAALKSFSDFDKAMTNSTSIMGDLSADLKKQMGDVAREMSTKTTFSATQLAEAYYFLASAGLTAKDSIEALPTVASFATAGEFDLAEATSYLADAQSALGLAIQNDAVKNMENMIYVSDGLVHAANIANASVEQFSVALTNGAAGAMRQFNVSLEDGLAVLSMFAQNGIKGEEAGTAFSIVLRDLSTQALSNKDAFEKLGIAVYDASGQMRSPVDILKDMDAALAGMSDESERAALGALGFTDKSIKFTAALRGSSDQIATFRDRLKEAGGVTEEVANKQMQSFSAQLAIVWNRLVDVATELGAALAPALLDALDIIRGGIKYLKDLATWFSGLSEGTKTTIIAFVGFLAALGPVLSIVGNLSLGIITLTKVISAGIGLVGGFASALGGLATVALGLPGLIIAATAAIAGLIYALSDAEPKIDKFKSGLQSIGGNSPETAVKGLEAVLGELQSREAALTKQVQSLDAAHKAYTATAGYDGKQAAKLRAEYNTQANTLSGLRGQIDETKTALDSKRSEVTATTEAVKKYTGATEGTSGPLKTFEGDLGEAGKKAQELKEKLEKFRAETLAEYKLDGLKHALDEARDELDPDKFVSSFQAYAAELKKQTIDSIIEAHGFGYDEAATLADLKLSPVFRDIAEDWTEDQKDAVKEGAEEAERQYKNAMQAVGDFTSDLLGSVAEGSGEDIAGSLLQGFEDFVIGADVLSNEAINQLSQIGQSQKDSIEGGGVAIGAGLGGLFGGEEGAKIGGDLGGIAGSLIAGMFGSSNAAEEGRKAIESFLEQALAGAGGFTGMDGQSLGANLIFGSPDQFNAQGWADTFQTVYDDGFTAFTGLGDALTQFLGVTEDVGGEIGYILAQNLGGSIDNARLLVRQLGLDAGDLEAAMVKAGVNGVKSWHEVEVALQGISQVTGAGLVGVNDLRGAFDQLIASGGRGFAAIDAVRNIAIEAMEAGASTLEELEAQLRRSGQFTENEIANLMAALSQRGITSLEALAGANDRTLGGIVADMESLGTVFSDAADEAEDLKNVLDSIESKEIDLDVNVEYHQKNEVPPGITTSALGNIFTRSGLKKFARGGVVSGATLFGYSGGLGILGEAGPEAIMPLERRADGSLGVKADLSSGSGMIINIDARGAEIGAAERIRIEMDKYFDRNNRAPGVR